LQKSYQKLEHAILNFYAEIFAHNPFLLDKIAKFSANRMAQGREGELCLTFQNSLTHLFHPAL
jgi:hypothetical protein